MGNNNALIVFLFMMIVIIGGGFAFFYVQMQEPADKAVTCKNEWSTISFLIEDEEKRLIMDGEIVSPDSIKTFHTSAIRGEWKHDGSMTKFYLDRLSGKLEVQTTDDFLEWEKSELDCNYSPARF